MGATKRDFEKTRNLTKEDLAQRKRLSELAEWEQQQQQLKTK